MAAALLAPSGASAASLPGGCPQRVALPVFSQFGDLSPYYLAPGGDFERPRWATAGPAARVEHNEPYYLAGEDDEYSMRLRNGGRVTSGRFCISGDMPHLRFLAKSPGTGQLDVRVDVYGANGEITDSSSGGISFDAHRRWAPSGAISLKTDGMEPGQTAYASVNFYSQGSWLIDDVFIDPYRRS